MGVASDITAFGQPEGDLVCQLDPEDRFVISKITGEISVRHISDKHIQHVPGAGGGTREVDTPENLRRESSSVIRN